MLFLFPYPSSKDLSAYYSKIFEYPTGIHNKQELERKARRIVRKMIHMKPDGHSFLDIGSGYGYLLDELMKYNITSVGVEPSYELWKQTTQKRYTVYHSSFESWHTKLQFDYISLIHVIEHVYDPVSFLDKVVNLLKPGGILYIETPNSDSWQVRAEGAQYTYLTPPDHLRLLSLSTITHLLPGSISPVLLSTYTEPEHVKNILKFILTHKTVSTHDSAISHTSEVSKDIPVHHPPALIKRLKYIGFDTIAAPLLSLGCNLGGYGSILELYYRKNE